MFVFRSAHSHSTIIIMPSSATGGKKKDPSGTWAEEKVKVYWRKQLRTLHTMGGSVGLRCVAAPSGQDDLLDIPAVFQNIPIDGAVGVIFLESPNMGRIPQTLKLSHPAQPSV